MVTTLRAGTTTGQDYRQWPDSFRLVYVIGYLQGYSHGRQFGTEATVKLIVRAVPDKATQQTIGERLNKPQQSAFDSELRSATCIIVDGSTTPGQTMAILDKYIDDHPERWDKPIANLAEEAFIDACDKRAKRP